MSFDIKQFSFCFNDSEYFNWFANPNEGNLKNIIKWKGLNRNNLFDNRNDFWNGQKIFTENLDVENDKIVTNAFIYHLSAPLEFPIIDQFAWKAMRKLKRNNTNKYFYKWDRDYLEIYIPFFNELYKKHKYEIKHIKIKGVKAEIIKRRMLDRAIWEYGRMLP